MTALLHHDDESIASGEINRSCIMLPAVRCERQAFRKVRHLHVFFFCSSNVSPGTASLRTNNDSKIFELNATLSPTSKSRSPPYPRERNGRVASRANVGEHTTSGRQAEQVEQQQPRES